jgi:hypothetical protein
MNKPMVHIKLDINGQPVLEFGGQQAPVAVMGKQFRWKGTDADMVELIYGLHLRGVIEADGRAADIKAIAELFGNWFGRELPNVYYTQMANQKRKKDKTPFLNSLIRVLMGDEGGEAST